MSIIDEFAKVEVSDDRDPVDVHIDHAKRHAFMVYDGFVKRSNGLEPSFRQYFGTSMALVAMSSFFLAVMRCERGAEFNINWPESAMSSPSNAVEYILRGDAFIEVIERFRSDFTGE